MSKLAGKKIIIGITGSIAAYKTCEIIRLLRKENVSVQVIMTRAAQQFIGKATLAALADSEVITEMFPDTPKAGLEHIEMALSGDAFVVLPATANIIAKAASGVADDMLSTALSVCEMPTLFVPAMNQRMWQNPAIMAAVETLKSRQRQVLNPSSGPLASLHEGEGRLPDAREIMNAIRALFDLPLPLQGKKVLITAGPTREPLDPVRYLSNHSSGKMGFAIAETARDLGAMVTMVTGPVALNDLPEVKMLRVETAIDMLRAIEAELALIQADHLDYDYIIMTAAVADFRPVHVAAHKIKRTNTEYTLKLEANPDILRQIRSHTSAAIVAFALETGDAEAEALRKMASKKAQFIVLNRADEPGAGFGVDTNRVIMFDNKGRRQEFLLDRKDRIAQKIWHFVFESESAKTFP